MQGRFTTTCWNINMYGRFEYGNRNAESERILDFFEAMEMKINCKHLVSEGVKKGNYESGENRSMQDFILERKGRTAVDIEVVYVSMQHKIILSEFVWEGSEAGGKRKGVPKLTTWELKEGTRNKFNE